MKLDRKTLRQVIKAETIGLCVVKQDFRASGHQLSTLEAIQLKKAKLAATIHHSIMAHERGKLHLTQRWSERDKCFYPLSREDQEKLIAEERPKFLMPDELDIAIDEAMKKEAESKTA
jgi:hypothetical protein